MTRLACTRCGHGTYKGSLLCKRCSPHPSHRKSERTCLTCGRSFRSVVGQYCSLPCRPMDVAARRRRLEEQEASRGRAVELAERRAEARAVREAERIIAEAARQAALQRTCDQCREPYLATYLNQRFCSYRCKNRWHGPPEPVSRTLTCYRCGSSFSTTKVQQVYCSGRCTRRAAKARARAVKKGTFIEDVSLALLAARDGYRCQICGRAVKMTAQVPHPRAPTIDHIVPSSMGGPHSYANTQLAHFSCNSVKGATGSGQLRLGLGSTPGVVSQPLANPHLHHPRVHSRAPSVQNRPQPA